MKAPKCKTCGELHWGPLCPKNQAMADERTKARIAEINAKTAAAIPPEQAAQRREDKKDPAKVKAARAQAKAKRKAKAK